MTAFKIAIIGAGSVGFTKKLVSDILKVPEFAGIEIALTDINAHNLDMIAQIIRRIVEVNGLPAKVTATTDRREALAGARYVMNCVRIGGLEAFADDIRIPLKYGVDQCVGDTICAGGIMYGQRGIVGDARLLPRHPRGRRARRAAAQLRQPDGDDDLGRARARRRQDRRPLPRRAERPPPDRPRPRRADDRGRHRLLGHQPPDLVPRHPRAAAARSSRDELLAAFEQPPGLLAAGEGAHRRAEALRLLLDRVRTATSPSTCPGTASAPRRSCDWIDLSDWIHGETGGYLRYCTENRNWFEEDFPKFLEEAGKPLAEHERTDEHASHILEALETGRAYRGHFNVRNGGTITNLPEDCIIESPGFVDRFGINMVEGITLPLACAATCSASVNVQRMAVQAAMTGDVDAPEAGGAARPAGRRDLHPRRGLADGRRAAGRAGAVAAAVRRQHPGGRRAPGEPPGQDPRLGRRGAAQRPQRRGAARRPGRHRPRKGTGSAPRSWAEPPGVRVQPFTRAASGS